MSVERRRSPAPWMTEETDACFVVRDHIGQPLAYVYFEDEPGRRTASSAASPPSRSPSTICPQRRNLHKT